MADGGKIVEVVRESRWIKRLWRGAQASLVAAAGALGIAIATRHPELVPPLYGLGAAIAGIQAAISMGLRRRKSAEAPTPARVDAGGIEIDGERLGREAIAEGTVTPRVIKTFARTLLDATSLRHWLKVSDESDVVHDVTLKRKGFFAWPLRLTVRDADEAWAILDTLRLGADRRAVLRKVMSPLLKPTRSIPIVFGIWIFIVISVALHGVPLLAPLGPLAMLAFIVLAFIRTKVTIGADGVSVRWLGAPTTVRLDDIAGVTVEPRTVMTPAKVVIARKSGPPLEIPVGLRGNNPFEAYAVDDEAALIAERIREAMAKGAGAEPVEFRLWTENRKALEPSAWVATLRGAAEEYRETGELPFTAAELWAVVENVRATAFERVAAIVALTRAPDQAVRARLGEAAQATAIPALKRALDAGARGDDGELTKVLAELHDEELAALRRGAPPPSEPRVRVDVPADEAEDADDPAQKKTAQKKTTRAE